MKISSRLTIFASILAFSNASWAAKAITNSQKSDDSIQLRFQGGQWFADCSFNGNRAAEGCLFDTGTPYNAVPSSLEQVSASFPIIQPYDAPGCDIRATQLTINQFMSPDKTAIRCADDGGGMGAVGLKTLGTKTWKFDMINNVLSQEKQIPGNLQKGVLGRHPNGHFGISIQIGHEIVIGAVDTGTQSMPMMDVSLINNIPDQVVFVKNGGTMIDGDKNIPTKIYKILSMNINGVELKSQEVIVYDFNQTIDKNFLDAGMKAVIGQSIIANHVWHFDLQNNAWAIEK